jgi:Zn-dependent M28 family amino/carboxypeptidase
VPPEHTVIVEHLRKHTQTLAGTIGERNLWRYWDLCAAADYCERSLATRGWTVSVQEFSVDGSSVRNVEAVKPGVKHPGEIIVVGAHYDTVVGSPGANDNGSGVAALFELCRLFGTERLKRTVRMVAFVNEEPPYFRTPHMGSMVYARRCRLQEENITGMLSLETIGCYRSAPGSQRYPPPLHLFYPSTGNFIGFVGNLRSRPLVAACVRSFRQATDFPVQSISAPGWIMGLGWSDHWAFWRYGYHAVMVTDTALFRYPFYHDRRDTPDKLDFESMARVVSGLRTVVIDLANKN